MSIPGTEDFHRARAQTRYGADPVVGLESLSRLFARSTSSENVVPGRAEAWFKSDG